MIERRGGSSPPASERPTSSTVATPLALSAAPLQMSSPGVSVMQSEPRWS